MNLRRGKQLPPVVWYIYRAEKQLRPACPSPCIAPSDQSESAVRSCGAPAKFRWPCPGLDLATKLRVFQRALRSRVERRDALLDIVRAVNTTLEPAKIADLIVERAATWVPAPCWAVVASDLSGESSVLAESGLAPDMGPAVYSIAHWVMQRGEDFMTADLRSDARVTDAAVGAVVAFPLTSPRPPRRRP